MGVSNPNDVEQEQLRVKCYWQKEDEEEEEGEEEAIRFLTATESREQGELIFPDWYVSLLLVTLWLESPLNKELRKLKWPLGILAE